jgi:hypothetical protein
LVHVKEEGPGSDHIACVEEQMGVVLTVVTPATLLARAPEPEYPLMPPLPLAKPFDFGKTIYFQNHLQSKPDKN